MKAPPIDPNTSGADGWDVNYETTDVTPAHHHYVFYYGNRIGLMREAWLIAAEEEFWRTKWYDSAWVL